MSLIHEQTSQSLETNQGLLSSAIVERQWQRQTGLAARYDETGKAKCVRDVGYNLRYLAHAIRVGDPALFVNYLAWVKVLFAKLNIPDDDLIQSLQFTGEVLQEVLSADQATVVAAFVATGLQRLPTMPTSIPSFINADNPHGDLAQQYLNHLLSSDRHAAGRLILNAAEQSVPVRDIYLHVFQPSQYEVGRLWQTNQISVAQEHFCTAATQLIMSQLYPYIFATTRVEHRLVATCVGQELHEIGIRIVADFFEMDGWDTYYLGANAPAESIATMVSERAADILAISATMTFHIGAVADLISYFRRTPAVSTVKIMVGGYPFNVAPDLWHIIGADGYATDAASVVAVAEQMITTG